MTTTSVKSNGASLSRASGTLVTLGDFSILGASKWSPAVNGNFPCAFALQGVTGASTADWVELFQDDVPNGDDIFQTWQLLTGSSGAALGSNAALINKWIHWAYSYVLSTSTLTIRAMLEGFNPSSPSFLLNTAVVVKVPVNNTTFLWNDNSGDLGIGLSQAHWIATSSAMSQAQVLAQFGQRAPTSVVTASAYSYLDMASTNPTNDLGSIASNFTAANNSGGTAFTIDPSQPSDWNPTSNGLFFGAGTTG